MIRGISIILFALCSLGSWGQSQVRGRVVSADNNKPIQGASIFISNTTKGTLTDEKGEFVLYNVPSGSYVLVITHIGYQTDLESIDSRSLKSSYDIALKTKAGELGEVVIRPFDIDGWKRWGELFKENFIGTTAFAEKCTIMNPGVIKLYYAKTRSVLSAYSEGPIIVQNKALGYLLSVDLEDFRMDFNNGDISFSFFPLFKELKGTPKDSIRWEKNRATAYYGSTLHFFRSLYHHRLREEGYSLHMAGRSDSTMIKKLKARLRYVVSERANAAQADSNISLQNMGQRPEAYLDRQTLASFDNVLGEDADPIDYPGEVDPAQIVAYSDTNTVVIYFDLFLNVKYLRMRAPNEYVNDFVIDPRNPASGHKVNVTRKGTEGMITRLELMRGFPVEVFPNGSYRNSDLRFAGFWSWWQKMGTLLPYDYDPPSSVALPPPASFQRIFN